MPSSVMILGLIPVAFSMGERKSPTLKRQSGMT